MIALALTNTDHRGTVTVAGDITLQAVDELKASLAWAIQNVDRVEINMDQVTAMDLSCLRLLCSAHRTALQMKKTFTLVGAKPDRCDRTVRSGSVCCSRNAADRASDCLWRRS